MLYIAAVIYNKRISDIASLDEILSFCDSKEKDDIKLIVVDNSDEKTDLSAEEQDLVESGRVEFIQNGRNLGLSKAYNKAFHFAMGDSSDSENDFMFLIDDDTSLSESYISKIYDEAFKAENHSDGINVITGLISSDGKPMSPTKGFRFSYKDSDYIVSSGVYDDICCINSGMAVRLSSLDEIDGFEESLFLDMVDYTMLYKLSKKKKCRVLVIPESIVQNFSGRDVKDKKVLYRRYEIYKKDFSTFCKISGRSRLYAWLHLLKRRIAIEIKS
ncbi:MAG: glycosyltransferase [Eubacterium sp.]|nr:glycosyltransferase [Eubacterium sp.]